MRSLFVLGLVMVVLMFAGAVVVAEDATITGTVEKTDAGLVIETDDGAVAVAPCKCEAPAPDKCAVCKAGTLCGKEVKATGAVEEKDGKKTITLTKVEEVKAE
ncbi:MAG: hypothetical protein AB1696_01645 [Planctomycetota bacterium]